MAAAAQTRTWGGGSPKLCCASGCPNPLVPVHTPQTPLEGVGAREGPASRPAGEGGRGRVPPAGGPRREADAVAATAGADAADLAWAAGLPPPPPPPQPADGGHRGGGWPPPLPAACGGSGGGGCAVAAPWATAWDAPTYAVELFDAAHAAGAAGGGGRSGRPGARAGGWGNPFGGGQSPLCHDGGDSGGGGDGGGAATTLPDAAADTDADARVAAAVAALRAREAALAARQTGGLDAPAVDAAVAALTALAAAADAVRAAASGGGRRP